MQPFTIELRAGERIPEGGSFDLEWLKHVLPLWVVKADAFDVYQLDAVRLVVTASWPYENPAVCDRVSGWVEVTIPDGTISLGLKDLIEIVHQFKAQYPELR